MWLLELWRRANRLSELGILGMNRRNAELILDHNPRRLYLLVDDKLRLHRLCWDIGVPSPKVFGVVERISQLRDLPKFTSELTDFVVKPNRGSAGRGILVFQGRQGSDWMRHNGQVVSADQLKQHVADVLAGMYSLGGRQDAAILQQRVQLHPAFAPISFQGIPDVRVILYRGQPAMAMLRLPTRESNGRANLHQGGLGVGIDIQSGVTCHAVQRNRVVHQHPDTGAALNGFHIPLWRRILKMAEQVAGAVGLGYLGVDIVIDAADGPLLLEANARPGLAIQIANRDGLVHRLLEIERGVADRSETCAPIDRSLRSELPVEVDVLGRDQRFNIG